MDAACSVVSTNDVILNRSCTDMGVGVSYVNGLNPSLEQGAPPSHWLEKDLGL
uniref:Uncharacterized protein n=1 Tax=Cucumis melo TaxID=3656 RepID=A0A9I9E6W9_CUCME